jgi:hypothetical protein
MSLIEASCRLSPAFWAEEALGFKPDETQRQILDSNYKRIIINCHRQWGKSSLSSVICTHQALFFERSLCLITAPALRQALEDFRKVLDFMDSLDQAPALVEDTKLSLQLTNKSRILCLPGGSDGRTIRGFSNPSVIVEDESAQCSDKLHEAIVPFMASNPDCKLILCSTPWGQKGHFYKIWQEGGQEWLKVRVIAEDNPRIGPAFLEEQRNGPNGPLYYQQEFCGEFLADEFTVFTEEMLKKMSVGDEDDEDNKEVNIFDY